MQLVLHPSGTDIFALDAVGICNPVNCVGVMGAGLAKAFKIRYPEMFDSYRRACSRGEVRIGEVWSHQISRDRSPRSVVYCVPTKRHWRDPSLLQDVEDSFVALLATASLDGVRSVAVPALGCGLGGLQWADVLAVMQAAMSDLSDRSGLLVHVIEPG